MVNEALSCDQARTLLEQGAQLVDVRQPEEFRRGAAPGAVNIPLPLIGMALQRLRTDAPVLLYCASGRRSGMAKSMLELHGFCDVHNVVSTNWLQRCA